MIERSLDYGSVVPVVLLITGLVICSIDVARIPQPQQPAERPPAVAPHPAGLLPEQPHVYLITPRTWAEDRFTQATFEERRDTPLPIQQLTNSRAV